MGGVSYGTNPPEHGNPTEYWYGKGCRCELCAQKHREVSHAYYMAHREQFKRYATSRKKANRQVYVESRVAKMVNSGITLEEIARAVYKLHQERKGNDKT